MTQTLTQTLISTPLPRGLSGSLCYVDGCFNAPTLCARHKRFGIVHACIVHDPIRYGQARLIGIERPATPQEAPQGPDPTQDASQEAQSPAELLAQAFALMLKITSQISDRDHGSDASLGDGGAKVPRRPISPAPAPATARSLPSIVDVGF